MTTMRRFPNNVKPCADCGQPFPLPDGMTRRAWLSREACATCEPARLRERIKANVEIDVNGCWLWKGSCAKEGYGQISVHDQPRAAHVVSYEVFIGPVPEGKEVCYTCDNRPCCNPEHFFAGTRADNVSDMWAKGRASKPPRITGERHPLATLSDDQVVELRKLRASGIPQRSVAKQFGVSQSTVWRLEHGISRSGS